MSGSPDELLLRVVGHYQLVPADELHALSQVAAESGADLLELLVQQGKLAQVHADHVRKVVQQMREKELASHSDPDAVPTNIVSVDVSTQTSTEARLEAPDPASPASVASPETEVVEAQVEAPWADPMAPAPFADLASSEVLADPVSQQTPAAVAAPAAEAQAPSMPGLGVPAPAAVPPVIPPPASSASLASTSQDDVRPLLSTSTVPSVDMATASSDSAHTMPTLAVADPGTLGATGWIDGLLRLAVDRGASDLHVHVGHPPMIRVDGELAAFDMPPVQASQSGPGLISLLTASQRPIFDERLDIDFAYTIPGLARFRVNLLNQRLGVDGVFRVIPLKVPKLAELGLPDVLAEFTDCHNGLVLLTGPKSCGKSTTLAALVDILNQSRPHHIITVEDPIEFVHRSAQCNVVHRQVGRHTKSFDRALRAALREDPDVIVVGELRDLESIRLAITAAETGHLVLGTMHTTGAIHTMYRLLEVFPPNQQPQVRTMLSESLRGVVSQRMVTAVPTLDGPKRLPVVEILDITPAISNLIREGKLVQIHSMMQTGRSPNMRALDDVLDGLMKAQKITRNEAMRAAIDKKRFIAHAQQRGR
jgi:twitching motility protein PilT